MRLSNTLMMNSTLMPTTKKAFTLAEVLITLSILGVVAALTIPSLVNRQSDLAAQVKLKKAISNYEDVIGIYMAENEEANAAGMITSCTGTGGHTVTDYFKAVDTPTTDNGFCNFTTADGVAWRIQMATGNATATDNKNAGSARYAVAMWNANNRVNVTGSSDNVSNVLQDGQTTISTDLYSGASLIDNTRHIVPADQFLQGTYTAAGDPTVSGTAPNHTFTYSNASS